MAKTTTALQATLLQTKGKAAPAADSTARGAAPAAAQADESERTKNLNFRVSQEFYDRFADMARARRIKLNALLESLLTDAERERVIK